MTDAADAVLRHTHAINACDLVVYRTTMVYPFTYQNYDGVALTIADALECGDQVPPPWEIIRRTHPSWSHSEFEPLEELVQSATSGVFLVKFRRVDADGESSELFKAVWIAVCKDGVWGVQFRHNLGCT